tara:strand:+ start:6481 stop:7989 length:1509 start_codon:yes stop_codon:yes gene_type:complete
MPKIFSAVGVVTGQPVEASQVSQSRDAFTGIQDYAISISGSLTTLGVTPTDLQGELKIGGHISQSALSASVGSNADVVMMYGTSEKFRTTNAGITVTGEVDATSIDVTRITASGDISVANITASGDISAADISVVELTASGDLDVQGNSKLGNTAADTTKITGSLHFNDAIGALGSAAMYNSGDTFFFTQSADGAKTQWQTDQFILKNMNNDETLLIANENTDVQLFYNNVRRFATTNEGAYISGSSTSTGLEVHDGTNTAFRSATQTRFDFAGNTYVSNDSTSGAARVAFALGGTDAANAKVAVSASNDLHVYSGSINVGSGQSIFTGSFGISKGNLNNNSTQNAVGYQSSEFYINQQNINATPDLIFRYYPWDSSDKGTYPLPALDNSNCYVVTMHVNLVLMQRGSDLVNPADKVGYLEYSSAFGLRGPGYQVAEITGGGVTTVNKTSNVLISGAGEFFVASPGTDQAYIAVSIDHGGSNIGAFPQIGGTVKITVAQQIA